MKKFLRGCTAMALAITMMVTSAAVTYANTPQVPFDVAYRIPIMASDYGQNNRVVGYALFSNVPVETREIWGSSINFFPIGTLVTVEMDSLSWWRIDLEGDGLLWWFFDPNYRERYISEWYGDGDQPWALDFDWDQWRTSLGSETGAVAYISNFWRDRAEVPSGSSRIPSPGVFALEHWMIGNIWSPYDDSLNSMWAHISGHTDSGESFTSWPNGFSVAGVEQPTLVVPTPTPAPTPEPTPMPVVTPTPIAEEVTATPVETPVAVTTPAPVVETPVPVTAPVPVATETRWGNLGSRTVNPNALHVRPSASADNNPIGHVRRGDTVNVVEIVRGWARITWNDGYAWVDSNFLN